jgi:hypothetical protein
VTHRNSDHTTSFSDHGIHGNGGDTFLIHGSNDQYGTAVKTCPSEERAGECKPAAGA